LLLVAFLEVADPVSGGPLKWRTGIISRPNCLTSLEFRSRPTPITQYSFCGMFTKTLEAYTFDDIALIFDEYCEICSEL